MAAGDAAGASEDRPMARFLADHGLRPEEAIVRAQRDLESRQDLEAWDTLAWALYRGARMHEAAHASEMALRLGTRRADFHFHAGMIRLALGDSAAGRVHLEQALSIDPSFDPLLADVARTALGVHDRNVG